MLQYQEQRKMGGEKFNIVRTPLTFSTDKVNLRLAPGESREDSFTILCSQGENVNGFVLSSRSCMQCMTQTFSGPKEIISYRFDAKAFSAGDTIDGFFRILSNHGEYRLPFCVTVMPPQMSSKFGVIRNLFHFTNLARTDWNEALRLFWDPSFNSLFTAQDRREKALYRGLSAKPGNEQNMEEFLISIGKKTAASFLPGEKEIGLTVSPSDRGAVVQRMQISRNGWGYSRVNIRVSGSFLQADRPFLAGRDFVDGVAEFSYAVNISGLHAGKNYGAIVLSNPFFRTEIPVTVIYNAQTPIALAHRQEIGQNIVCLMQEYENFRAHKISAKDFLARAKTSIAKLCEADRNNPITQLYRIHYLITSRQYEEALWALQDLNRRLSGEDGSVPAFHLAQFDLEDDTVYAYRMYLTILCAEDTEKDEGTIADITEEAVHGIAQMHNGNPDNWWIAWLLLYAADEMRKRPSGAWMILRDSFDRGCRSPLLYIEAYDMVSTSPAILHELGAFELQVLLYAVREGILTEQVMTQVNYLAGRSKTYSDALLHILSYGYEKTDMESLKRDSLQSICEILIRGGKTDEKSFPWYQKGVEAQLSITRLFEYYMMSMPSDFDGEIPQMVIMYFAWQSTLPYERNAYLYRYVAAHRDDSPVLFSQYRPQIDAFTAAQLMNHRMTPDLAALYTYYLGDGRVLTEDLAAAAVVAAFTCCVKTADPRMKRVVLVYDQCRSEQYYPLKDGTCYLPVYGTDNRIYLEDDEGSRYAQSVPYLCENMMDQGALARALSAYAVDNFGYSLYLAGKLDTSYRIDAQSAPVFRRLADNTELTGAVRQKVRLALLQYYDASDDIKEMDAFLTDIRPDNLTAQDRAELIRWMVIRGLNDKALGWIRRYGTFHVDGKTLMELCTQVLAGDYRGDDQALSCIVHEAFLKGKYDENILLYLEQFLDACSDELEEVRRAAAGFGITTYPVCRRLLIQMLYTGRIIPERTKIIESFMREDPDSPLLPDVLAQSSHDYFIHGGAMGAAQIDLIARYGKEGVPITDICRIAWLKDCEGRASSWKDANREVISLFLEDLLQRGIVFPFFRQFLGYSPSLQAYADETLVEYRAPKIKPDAHVLYHYAMEKDGVREPYRAKEMKEMYEGVYVTGFLLFFGEQMHYYITDDAAEKNITESGTTSQDARIPEDSGDRFGRINRISMLAALGRDQEAMENIEQYARRSFIVDALFGKDDTDAV